MTDRTIYSVAFIVLFIASISIYVVAKPQLQPYVGPLQHMDFELPYDLDTPDKSYFMPKKLKEISALSMVGTHEVLTVNDEEGLLFRYDLIEEKVVSEIDFGKHGDYEAVTRKGNTAYICESNGNIKVVDLTLEEKVDEFNTPLSARDDVEGLCYDASKNQLLIACKGQLEKRDKKHHMKGIYTFDLETNKFDDTPYKLLDLVKEQQVLSSLNTGEDPISKKHRASRLKSFAPSGIAINPITLNIYLLSSRGKTLTVMDSSKEVLGIYFLSDKIYGQPEGITFDGEGSMYISNEDNSTEANILRFTRLVN